MNEEWGTPISKDKIIYRRNKLVELAKVEAKPYTIWHETINENLLDINYMIYEIERLKELCDKYEEEHKTTFETWQKDIKESEHLRTALNTKESIIKEAREYIKWHYDLATDENVEFCLLRDRVLEILDKEVK